MNLPVKHNGSDYNALLYTACTADIRLPVKLAAQLNCVI